MYDFNTEGGYHCGNVNTVHKGVFLATFGNFKEILGSRVLSCCEYYLNSSFIITYDVPWLK